MKLPKNLIKVIDELNTDNLFAELFLLEYQDRDLSKETLETLSYRKKANVWNIWEPNTPNDTLRHEINILAEDIFHKIIGMRSCSDLLDYATHENFSEYSVKYKEKNDPNEDRNDYFDEVKHSVVKKIGESFANKETRLGEFKSFKNIIRALHALGKNHLTEPNYLEYIIVNSRIFQNYVLEQGISYGG